jgi:hypothetical protein
MIRECDAHVLVRIHEFDMDKSFKKEITKRVPLLSTFGGSRIHFEIRAQCHLVVYRSYAP